jgi:hypothetical protein
MLTGLLSCALVLAALLIMAGVFQGLCYAVTGIALDILEWPVTCLFDKRPTCRQRVPLDAKYGHVPQQDLKRRKEDSCTRERYRDCTIKTLHRRHENQRYSYTSWLGS